MQPKDYEELPDKNPKPSAPPGGAPKTKSKLAYAKYISLAVIGVVVYLVLFG